MAPEIFATHRYPKGIHDSRFFPDSNALHPGLAVVDIDRDGHDDLYVAVRWGKNMLLRNQGDGTFIEEAARWGLDIESRSNAALFADFDNDGDADLMLGRSLEPSMYLVNEGDRFVDRSASLVSSPLPHLVTSVSAADYNGDGLLDVYLSTYTPIVFNERVVGDRTQALSVANDHLQGKALYDFQARYAKEHHRLFDEVGPPNVLLVNRGGRFDVAPESVSLAQWRNTFQGICPF